MPAAAWAEHERLNPLRREGALARLGPFLAVGLVAYGLLPVIGVERPVFVAMAAGLTAATAIAAVVVPWEQWGRGVTVAVPLAALVSIELTRLSGLNATDVYVSLFAMPILWTALYERIRELMIVLAATVTVVVYDAITQTTVAAGPTERWAEVVVLVAVGTLIAWAIQRLVRDLHRREHLLGSLASMSRRLDGDTDTRQIISDELRQASGSNFTSLYEPTATGALACTSGATAGRPAPALAERAAGDREPVFERRQSPDEWKGLPQQLKAVLCMPVEDGEILRGVLVVGWERAPEASDVLVNGVRLTADQLAAALAREERISRLDELARIDGLTGVANRREWDSRLPRELSRARRTGDPLVVGMADLDHFKPFNDSHGHQAGDDVLRETGARWMRSVRDTDVLARYGGEEFALAFPNCDAETAVERAEELRGMIASGQTASIGLALWDRRESAADLVARADRALYAAKAAGRDRVVVDAERTTPLIAAHP